MPILAHKFLVVCALQTHYMWYGPRPGLGPLPGRAGWVPECLGAWATERNSNGGNRDSEKGNDSHRRVRGDRPPRRVNSEQRQLGKAKRRGIRPGTARTKAGRQMDADSINSPGLFDQQPCPGRKMVAPAVRPGGTIRPPHSFSSLQAPSGAKEGVLPPHLAQASRRGDRGSQKKSKRGKGVGCRCIPL